jgi:hypothetical protein
MKRNRINQYSKGISWFDDCRIPFVDENINLNKVLKQTAKENNFGGFDNKSFDKLWYKPQGRFPANLLVCDDMLNDGVISNSSGGKGEATKSSLDRTDLGYGYKKIENAPGLGGYGDKGTNSRYYDIDKWFDKIINYE